MNQVEAFTTTMNPRFGLQLVSNFESRTFAAYADVVDPVGAYEKHRPLFSGGSAQMFDENSRVLLPQVDALKMFSVQVHQLLKIGYRYGE